MQKYPIRRVGSGFFLACFAAGQLSASQAEQAPAPQLQDREPASLAPPARARSVLFYLMDTSRGDRMSYDAYARDTTPFLRWLAERSVVFTQCNSQAPWTKPSMASMLSSQYPSTTGIYRVEQRLDQSIVTWPELLQANGLYTVGFSANIVMGNSLSDFAQGFDHFVESTLINRADPIRFASGSARKLNEHAFGWLDEHPKWPLLLYMHSVDPHEEYEPEPEYLKRFADPQRHAQFRKDWSKLLASRPPIPGLYVTRDNFERSGVDSTTFIEHASNLYDADILANDAEIQALWNKLQEAGWGEDFIFVLTSDHGDEFFEHGGTSHGYSLYEEMLHVPLLIYAPGLLPGGKRIETPVRSLDIYPTLCELLGIETPQNLEGRSLLPLILGHADVASPEIIAEHREDPVLRRIQQGSGMIVSLRSGRWKLIFNQVGSQIVAKPTYELFDLERDPGEQENLAEAHPQVVQALSPKLEDFIARQWKVSTPEPQVALQPEVLDELRALGYIGEEDEGEAVPDLWEAIQSWDQRRVKLSLAAGANVDQLDPTLGVHALCMAAMADDIPMAKLLLKAGARLDAVSSDGSQAVHSAVLFGRIAMLEFLLDQGADPWVKNQAGDNALKAIGLPWESTKFIADLFQVAVEREAVESGRQLCAELIELIPRRETPNSRLFAAIESGDPRAATQALDEGASTKALDSEKGWTPLYSAVTHKQEAIVRSLIARGADPQTRNRDQSSALHGAALMGHSALLQLLIESGADVHAKDADGSTALHAAAFLGRVEALTLLLKANADRDQRNQRGSSALDLARTDWATSAYVLGLLGISMERAELERERAKVIGLLQRED